MATSVGKENDKLEMLEDLIKLDYAAAEAYEAAVERLDNESYRRQLTFFRRDHERHIEELAPVVRDLGGNPPEDAGMKEMLTEGKVVLSGLMGDESILKAMKSNENDTNTAYERVLEKCPVEARPIVERGLADERRHCEWILVQLGEQAPTMRSQTQAARGEGPRPGR